MSIENSKKKKISMQILPRGNEINNLFILQIYVLSLSRFGKHVPSSLDKVFTLPNIGNNNEATEANTPTKSTTKSAVDL